MLKSAKLPSSAVSQETHAWQISHCPSYRTTYSPDWPGSRAGISAICSSMPPSRRAGLGSLFLVSSAESPDGLNRPVRSQANTGWPARPSRTSSSGRESSPHHCRRICAGAALGHLEKENGEVHHRIAAEAVHHVPHPFRRPAEHQLPIVLRRQNAMMMHSLQKQNPKTAVSAREVIGLVEPLC